MGRMTDPTLGPPGVRPASRPWSRVAWISRRGVGQQGAAIVSALLVVALSTTVVAGLFVRENVALRSVENRLALSQTRWIERAALDWAKVILRADAAAGGGVDHLGEPWAVPVAETRLDETVTAGARIDGSSRPAGLTGQILDAQSRFNLASLVQDGKRVGPSVAAFRRLLVILGQPERLTDLIVTRLLASQPRMVDGKSLPSGVLPLIRLDDLRSIAGIDAATVEALRPFAIVLPAPTTVNLNTAPAEVLAAMIPELDLPAARRFVVRRERAVFRSLADASALIESQPVLAPALLSVGSSYFLVRGVVRFDRVETSSETLLSRNGQKIELLWQQRY